MKKSARQFIRSLCEISEAEVMTAFLREILTPSELKGIICRWEICRLLLKSVPQREIAKKLGVSSCNITRGSKELGKKNSIIRRILEKEEEGGET